MWIIIIFQVWWHPKSKCRPAYCESLHTGALKMLNRLMNTMKSNRQIPHGACLSSCYVAAVSVSLLSPCVSSVNITIYLPSPHLR